MLADARPISRLSDVPATELPDYLADASEPVVFTGLVKDWPAVKMAERGIGDINDYLESFYQGELVTAYRAPKEANGRIFYRDDMQGFNFQAASLPLPQLLATLETQSDSPVSDTFYVGSSLVDKYLPGFRAHNDLPLGAAKPLVSLWVGNRCTVAAHFDFPQNLACNVAGRRRFTLFPPEQVENLYIGPLDYTPSGQPISLVDFDAPDLERFPKFAQACRHALQTTLAPGDVLFIPSMWWHHVKSLDAYNVLINYWWRDTPDYLGAPVNTLDMALLTLRSLPKAQRQAWKHLLDYYVFSDADTTAHIPKDRLGNLDKLDPGMASKLRTQILNRLSR